MKLWYKGIVEDGGRKVDVGNKYMFAVFSNTFVVCDYPWASVSCLP